MRQRSFSADRAAATTPSPVSAASVLAVVAAVVSAWVAVGAVGFLSDPLRRGLSLFALGVAAVAARPSALRPAQNGVPGGTRDARSPAASVPTNGGRRGGVWKLLPLIAAIVLGATGVPIVAVLAPALLLAALAHDARDARRPMYLAAGAALCVEAVFLLATSGSPLLAGLVEALGSIAGSAASIFAREPLSLGRSFAGCDYLLVVAVVMVLAQRGARPRWRAWLAGCALLGGVYLLYLLVIGQRATLLAAIPPVSTLPASDMSYVRLFSVNNAARSVIAWNLPAVGLAMFSVLLGGALCWGRWEEQAKAAAGAAAQTSHGSHESDLLACTMLGLLAAVLPIAALVCSIPATLEGKRIVALDAGAIDWSIPNYESAEAPVIPGRPPRPAFGLLPELIGALGGRCALSTNATAEDLRTADAAILVGRTQPPSAATQRLARDFLHAGKTLVVAATPGFSSDQLVPEAARGFASVKVAGAPLHPAAAHAEECLAFVPHPATCAAADHAASLAYDSPSCVVPRAWAAEWSATPLVVARYASASWEVSRSSGEQSSRTRLGDVWLAAEQHVGRGRLIVLGSDAPLTNDRLPWTHADVARLLAYAASPEAAAPRAGWRQLITLSLAAVIVGALVRRPGAQLVGGAALAMGLSAWACAAAASGVAEIPLAKQPSGRPIAVVDRAHLERFSDDLGADFGLERFLRLLMQDGYLPLVARRWDPATLDAASLLVLVAPQRPFSAAERADVVGYVARGGHALCMVGAEDVDPAAPLLAEFDCRVPRSPVPLDSAQREPEPLGGYYSLFLDLEGFRPAMRFYAAWPVECSTEHEPLKYGPRNCEIIVRRRMERGSFTLIGDSFLAVNAIMPSEEGRAPLNLPFWRWLLSRVRGGPTWVPPRPSSAATQPPLGVSVSAGQTAAEESAVAGATSEKARAKEAAERVERAISGAFASPMPQAASPRTPLTPAAGGAPPASAEMPEPSSAPADAPRDAALPEPKSVPLDSGGNQPATAPSGAIPEPDIAPLEAPRKTDDARDEGAGPANAPAHAPRIHNSREGRR